MTLEEFVKDDANLAKFEACETQEQVNALLAAEGITTDGVSTDDELSEEDLENVAGGVSWIAVAKVAAFIIMNWDAVIKVCGDVGSALAKGGKALYEWYNRNKGKLRKGGLKTI